jgi:hypothetical protein
MGEWIPLVVAVLGVVTAALGGKIAWTRGRAIQATAKAIEAFKQEMAASDQPDTAKVLTRAIGASLETAGPAVKAAHERQVAAAGANLTAILGPVIARLARPSDPPPSPQA